MNKTGRNDPCPCGSGKKYKQCCQAREEAAAVHTRPVAPPSAPTLQMALLHHQAGRLAEAEAIYRQILRTRPNDPDATHFLGLAAHQAGNHGVAVELIGKAIRLAASPQMHCHLGNVYQAMGKLEMAEREFHRALALQQDYAEAHNNLASVYKQQGKIDAAIASLRKSLKSKPDFALGYGNLAAMLHENGDIAGAIENYTTALARKPDYPEAHANLGLAFQVSGRIDEAVSCFRNALALRPQAANVHRNLASALKQQGKLNEAIASYQSAINCRPDFALAYNELGGVLQEAGQYAAAIAHHQQAIALKPDYAEAHNNLAGTYYMAGNPGLALESVRRALSIDPNNADAWNNFGNILQSSNDLEQAGDAYYRALALRPDHAEAHNNLGNVLKHQGRLDAAVKRFQQALSFRPDYLEAHSNLLFTMSADARYTPAQYLEEARRYGAKASAQARPYTIWPQAQAVAGKGRLRVGLVSGDLKTHPVGFFLESILAHLDPQRVELVAYPTKLQEDELTARIKPRFAAWHSLVGLDDAAAARRIHEDGVQVLLDLAGHTAFNRLPVFGWKPAPVQASWLGYFASTGLPAMDYVIADPVSVPAEQAGQFTEKVWQLPETRLCFTPPSTDLEVAPLPALRNGYVTFGCFQTLSKLSDEVLAAWGRIFTALPQARLRVQNKQMSCEGTREAFLGRLSQAGIAAGRVMLVGPMDRDAYLAVHGEVDLLLDTFPYPGGTTTCEALWMGVPTVTLAGSTMLSRQGAGLLQCAGLAEWIAADADGYVSLAVRHATDTGKLSQLRQGLRGQVRVSPLFDAARFASHLQDALTGMWQAFSGVRVAGNAPSTLPIAQVLQAGLQHHQAGRIQEAESHYRHILQVEPNHPDALHLLGVLAHQVGRHDVAIDLIRKAVAANPDVPMYHGNLANALLAHGDVKNAIDSYRKAIALKPDYAEACSNLGNALKAQGDMEGAVASYHAALTIRPDYPEAHYNLATTLKEQGRIEEAIVHFRKAIALKKDFYPAYGNLGNALKEQGKLPEAVENYRQAIACKPDFADGHLNLALALREMGMLMEAADSYRRAISINPRHAEAFHSLGILLKELGDTAQAVECYQQAIRIEPGFVEAYVNLGVALQALRQLDSAAEAYQAAIARKPDFVEAYSNLGTTLQEQGKLAEAAAQFQQAIALRPDFAVLHYNLGNTLQLLDKMSAAAESYRKAIELDPCYAEARNNLGNVLQAQGSLEAAAEQFRHALAMDGDYAEAHNNLGNVLRHQVHLDQAASCYRKALSLKPDYLEAHSNLLFTMSADARYTPAQYLEEARRYGAKAGVQARPYTSWPQAQAVAGKGRLRVGLVSGDLKTHPVGFFLESILAHLDPQRVELVAYPTKLQEDELTARIKPRFAAWHSLVGLDDAAAARRIHEDGVQVLLDLAGHTAFNRLPVFAWKPAPVQASWLGYFASTGLPAMDYVIADLVSVPAEQAGQFTEKVWQLPETRLCFTPPSTDLEIAPLPALRNGYVTFGCFQTLSKLSDEVLAAWGRIFAALPQARLRVQNKQMSCEGTREAFLGRLSQAGIAAGRVMLVGPMDRDAYLAVHGEVDLLLDTFPYPGGTTTCEALWMGVPTVTLAGNTMLSRQGAGLLQCAGLADWIAADADGYVSLAVRHATDTGKLSQLRQGLRGQVRVSPLFDAARFASHLQDALTGMWQATSRGG